MNGQASISIKEKNQIFLIQLCDRITLRDNDKNSTSLDNNSKGKSNNNNNKTEEKIVVPANPIRTRSKQTGSHKHTHDPALT